MAYIAKALVAEPNVLILDEPESNLDFYNQSRVLRTVKDLSSRNRTTVIINSHHVQNMLSIADKRLLLSEHTYRFGNIDTLITAENIKIFFNTEVLMLPFSHEGKKYKTFVLKV